MFLDRFDFLYMYILAAAFADGQIAHYFWYFQVVQSMPDHPMELQRHSVKQIVMPSKLPIHLYSLNLFRMKSWTHWKGERWQFDSPSVLFLRTELTWFSFVWLKMFQVSSSKAANIRYKRIDRSVSWWFHQQFAKHRCEFVVIGLNLANIIGTTVWRFFSTMWPIVTVPNVNRPL